MKKSTITSAKFSAQSAKKRQMSILTSAKFGTDTLDILDTLASPQERATALGTMVADGKAKCPAIIASIADKGNFARVPQFMTDYAIAMQSMVGQSLEHTADKMSGRIGTMRRACDSYAAKQGKPLSDLEMRSPKGQSMPCYSWVKKETSASTGSVESAPADIPAANAEKETGKSEKASAKKVQAAVKSAIAATQAESAETISTMQSLIDQLQDEVVKAKCGEYRALCLAKSYQLAAGGISGGQKSKLTKAVTAARVAANRAMQTTGTVAAQRKAKLDEIRAAAAA